MQTCKYCYRTGFSRIKSHYNACEAKISHDSRLNRELGKQEERSRQEKLEKIRKEGYQQAMEEMKKIGMFDAKSVINNNIIYNVNIYNNTINFYKNEDKIFNKFAFECIKLLPVIIDYVNKNGFNKNKIKPLLIESALENGDENDKRLAKALHTREYLLPDDVETVDGDTSTPDDELLDYEEIENYGISNMTKLDSIINSEIEKIFRN
jgi:hypothetical protein